VQRGISQLNKSKFRTAEFIFCLGLLFFIFDRCTSAQTLDLHLSFSSLTFEDINPLSRSDIPAQENPVSALVSYSGPGVVNIYMEADGNMIGPEGAPPIPASNIHWTAVGSGYESGTLSDSQPVVASTEPLANSTGDGWFFHLKSGVYDTGTYSLSITVMATAQ
jgi:hypothetical protein